MRITVRRDARTLAPYLWVVQGPYRRSFTAADVAVISRDPQERARYEQIYGITWSPDDIDAAVMALKEAGGIAS